MDIRKVKKLIELLEESNVHEIEIKEGEELFHWFMSQEGRIKGFTKSYWSGVTSLELAKAVEWVIEKNIQGLYHITNGIPINKYELLMLFKKYTNKEIEIESIEGKVSDKSFLDTRKEINYAVPGYEKMISEMILFIKYHRTLYKQYTIVD